MTGINMNCIDYARLIHAIPLMEWIEYKENFNTELQEARR